MAGLGEACLKDADCGTVLVCYLNVSWAEELGFVPSFCSCLYWYGWEPSADGLCRTFSAMTHFLLASSALQLALALVACFFAGRGTLRMLSSGPVVWNASTTTLLLLDVSFVALLIWRVALLVITSTPENNTRFVTSSGSDDLKFHTYLPLERAAFVTVYLFSVLAILNVSLMWLQTAAASRKLSRKANKNVTQYRRAVMVLEGVWVVLLVGSTLLGQVQVAALLAVPFAALFSLTFAVGRSRMVSLLSDVRALEHGGRSTGASGSEAGSMSGSASKLVRGDSVISTTSMGGADAFFDAVILRIRKTTAFFLTALAFTAASALSFAVGSIVVGQREANRLDNKFHPLVIATELTSLGLLATLAPLLWYVLTSTPSRRTRTTIASFGDSDHAASTNATHAAVPPTSTRAPSTAAFDD